MLKRIQNRALESATYGAADFEANYRATRYGKENAGMRPLSTPYAESCTCESHLTRARAIRSTNDESNVFGGDPLEIKMTKKDKLKWNKARNEDWKNVLSTLQSLPGTISLSDLGKLLPTVSEWTEYVPEYTRTKSEEV